MRQSVFIISSFRNKLFNDLHFCYVILNKQNVCGLKSFIVLVFKVVKTVVYQNRQSFVGNRLPLSLPL